MRSHNHKQTHQQHTLRDASHNYLFALPLMHTGAAFQHSAGQQYGAHTCEHMHAKVSYHKAKPLTGMKAT
jgi:hypothetical protein